MPLALGLVLVLLVVFGIPMLCRAAIRRMGASEGMRDWLRAYGPRLPFLEGQEHDDSRHDDLKDA